MVAICGLSVGAVALQQQSGKPGQRWALLIGINGYQALGELPYCVDDARLLKRVLIRRAGYEETHVALLTDEAERTADRPTLASIRRRVAQIADTAEAGDTILVFFSGHGITRGGEAYLVPVDGDRLNAVPLSWVKNKLEDSKAACKMLILDACHSGSAAKGISGVAPGLGSGGGVTMLLSSKTEQVSYPDERLGHSVFTYYLSHGLSGAAAGPDRRVTVRELHRHVREKLKEWSFQTGRQQTPVLVGASASEQVLAHCPDDERSAVLDLEAPEGWEVENRRIRVPAMEGEITREIAFYTGVEGIRFVRVSAGTFMMGSPPGEGSADEHPRRKVRISTTFYMSATEVTQREWEKVMGTRPWSGRAQTGGTSTAPANYVSWEEARAFCRRLSQRSSLTVRLPTEAEWEYACRAGVSATYCFGDEPDRLDNYGWYEENAREEGKNRPQPVARKQPNAWGLYDMHGNVWEWCRDVYGNYTRSGGTVLDPEGRSQGHERVLRGGSWRNAAESLRSAARGKAPEHTRAVNLGFRIVVER
jgi:formylglycine-generating enzyme required for sulfatase activity